MLIITFKFSMLCFNFLFVLKLDNDIIISDKKGINMIMIMIMIGGAIEDPRPSLMSTVVQSSFGDYNEKSRDQEEMKVSSISDQKLGWPLLRRVHTDISRDISVVQWVMNLPDRSNHNNSSQIEKENYQKLYCSNCCKWFLFEVLSSCTCQFSSG